MLENEEQQGAVFYTDGGCGPTNPGFMGYGIHGYIYKFDKPKKGAGLVSHVLTSVGYVSKSNLNTDNNEQVTPISYIDRGCTVIMQNYYFIFSASFAGRLNNRKNNRFG